MTGGGFGGCTVTLCRAHAADHLMQSIGEAYRDQTGIDAPMFITRATDGARPLTLP
jgi:galactokinase